MFFHLCTEFLFSILSISESVVKIFHSDCEIFYFCFMPNNFCFMYLKTVTGHVHFCDLSFLEVDHFINIKYLSCLW